MSKNPISKKNLIRQIARKLNVSIAKATVAYETVLLESPAFRKQSVKIVKATTQKAVKVPGKTTIKKVNLKKEKAVKKVDVIEKIEIVEVEIPYEVEKIVEVIKEVEVVREVPVIVEKTIVKEVKVVKEVPVEVIKEVTMVREVELVKEVKVRDEKEIKLLKSRLGKLKADYKLIEEENKKLVRALKAKPKEIEVIREVEVPVEIIREIEVVKQIDFASLEKMMRGMKTVEVSKTLVGETRTTKESKIVDRREVKPKSGKTKRKVSQKDDLTKIEGIGPKIKALLYKNNIQTFADLASSKVGILRDILDAAGSKYNIHDPKTWAKQAKLARDGKWDKLSALQQVLDGGK